MKLYFADIRPYIRYAQQLKITDSSNFCSLTAYDNRFFFCQSGKGTITVAGKDYAMQRGCLILWRAGLLYDLKCEAGGEMTLLGFNFDFTAQGGDRRAPIPPAHDDFDSIAVTEQAHFTDAECLNHVLYINNMHRVESEVEEICNEYLRHIAYYDTKISGLLVSVLTEAVRESMLENESIRHSRSIVEEILAHIAKHYNEEITNAELGRRFGYHPNYINHLVVQHTGMSLHKYVLKFRINKAIELLQTTDLTVSRISEQVGFYDYNHFLKYFKQATGYTTKAFRG